MSEATRLLGGVRSAVTASDPGLARLRLAGTTIATLVATLVVLGVPVTVAGRPVTVAMPGLVLAMIASMAAREDEPVRQAVSIALLIPAAAIGVGLETVIGSRTLVTDAVFVVVAVSAVFLQRLGPRGTATGMVGFISYFLALFVGVSVGQLPAVVVAVMVGAVVCVLMRTLLRPRHPERDLRRMLAALGVRAGGVVELLGEGMREGALSPRLARRLRARVSRVGETAMSVEQHLDDANEPLLGTIGKTSSGCGSSTSSSRSRASARRSTGCSRTTYRISTFVRTPPPRWRRRRRFWRIRRGGWSSTQLVCTTRCLSRRQAPD